MTELVNPDAIEEIVGVKNYYPWTGWRRVQDQPVRLEISRGYLMPEFAAYREATP